MDKQLSLVQQAEMAYVRLMVDVPVTNPARIGIQSTLCAMRNLVCTISGEDGETVQDRNESRACEIIYKGKSFREVFDL